nr:hypothetical protein [Allomuricauda sp.]
MKQLSLWIFLLTTVGISWVHAQQKQSTEIIKKEISMENNEQHQLVVKNVFGNVSVEGYSGNLVLIEVEKKVYADDSEGLDLGKAELTLEVIQDSKRIVLHPQSPYMEFDGKHLKFNWCGDHQDPPYDHQMNFKIKVPNKLGIDVSTVNNGEISVSKTRGNALSAGNINGGIRLNDVTGKTKIHCINGAVEVRYADNPTSDSEYYSLNGDINISYQKSLSANISFKSMNGELYTDFDINKQFIKTSKESSKRSGPKFKYEAKPIVQIGSGAVDFDFETLNGNVFIKKI